MSPKELAREIETVVFVLISTAELDTNVNVESMSIGVNAHCASITYLDTAKGVKHVRLSNIVKETVEVDYGDRRRGQNIESSCWSAAHSA